MADYVLSAKGTYDGSNFDGGIDKSKGKLQGFLEEARSVGQKVKSALGDGIVKTVDGITSSIGQIGAGVMAIAATGGITRALNMEQAKTMFKGLKLEWGDYEKTIMDAVDGTAFSMDAAALVAANLAASGVAAGADMEKSLNGATGAAATFGADLGDIGSIYQKVAAQGKVSGETLEQLSSRGINGLNVLSEHLGKTQEEVRDMVKKGQIDFNTFSDAMYETFGESAKGANDTFTGVTANIRSNIAKIGEIFATPALHGLQQVFAALLPVIKSVRVELQPLADAFAAWIDGVVPKAVAMLEQLNEKIKGLGEGGLGELPMWAKVAAAAIGVLSIGAMGGLVAEIPVVGGLLGGLFGMLGKLSTPAGTLRTALLGVSEALGVSVGPILAVIAVIGTLIAAFATLMATDEEFRATIMGLVGDIGASLAPAFQSLQGLLPPLQGLFQSVMNVVRQLAPAILGLVAAFAPVVSTIVSAVVPIIGKLMGIIGSLLEQITGFVVPIIKRVTATVRKYMPQIQQIITSAMQVIGQIIDTVWPHIQAIITAAMQVIEAVIETVWPIIEAIISTVMNAIQAVIAAVSAAINGDWDAFWNAIKDFVLAIWNGIGNIIGTAITSIQQNLGNVLNAIKGLFMAIWNAISTFVLNIWNGIKAGISGAINAVYSVISSVLSAIQSWWNSVWSAISSFANLVWNNIKSIVSGAASAISGTVSGMVGAVAGFFSSLWSSITSAASSMWSSVSSAFSSGVSNAVGVVRGLPGQIMGIFSGVGSWLWNSGASLIQGLIDGIRSKLSEAKAIVSDGLSNLRGLFPFSPAKEGPFSGKGWVLYSGISIMDALAEGAESRTRKTIAAYSGIAEKVRDSLDIGDASFGYTVNTQGLAPEFPSDSYGNKYVGDTGDSEAEKLLAYLYGEVADLNSTLGRKIRDNAPVVTETERQAARRYRRAQYA